MAGEPQLLRQYLRYAVFATAAGAGIGFLISRMQFNPRALLHGGLIGLSAYSASFLAEMLFHRWIDAKPGQWWRRPTLYFVASQIGWPIGLFFGMWLIWGQRPRFVTFNRASWLMILVLGVAGVMAGLGAVGYERLKERLRASVAQLKEAEFAEKELQLARAFQSRMLPAPEITADGYRITSRNFAARYVAGDFYDVFRHPDGAVGVALADVAGKGLAASLIMASVKSVLPLLAGSRSANGAMGALNDKLVNELSKREFVAMALARFEPQSGRVSIANAGIPDPYVVRADGSVETVNVPGIRLPIGLRPHVEYDQAEVHLQRGDSLIFVSDGLPEATRSDGEPLGYDRLAAIVKNAGANVDDILAAIQAETTDARDDDQTIVMLQRMA